MTIHFYRSLLAVLVLVTASLGCSGDPEPTRRVQLGEGLLDMMISDLWELEETTDEGRVYIHKEFENVRLYFSSSTEDFGNPLRVTAVKSLIGRELNLKYGGVSTRVSLGGNAMIKYTRTIVDEAGGEVRLEEWVVAKPVGHSDIARVEISLRIPVHAESHPSIPALIEGLDKQVGDARIPRA
jgi:hypothetical protein